MSVVLEPSSQLSFRRPLTQATKELLMVINPSNEPIMFKVKTTTPKQYCVRPNSGRVEPHSQVEVQVILQPFKEEPPLDYKCKDKFLVQTAVIKPEYESLPMADMWSRVETEDKASVFQQKIRCAFVSTEEVAQRSPTEAVKEQGNPVQVPMAATEPAPSSVPEPSPVQQPVARGLPPRPQQFASALVPPPASEPIRVESSVSSGTRSLAVSPPVLSARLSAIPSAAEQPVPVATSEPLASTPPIQETAPVAPAPAPAPAEDKEKIKLQQELADALALVKRLQGELAAIKKEQEIKAAQVPVSPKAPSAHPHDAVHQHLAALEKHRGNDGYPPQVVLIIATLVFMFTYLFF